MLQRIFNSSNRPQQRKGNQTMKKDLQIYTVFLEREIKRTFKIAIVRSPYKSQRAFFRDVMRKLCEEYAPDDLETDTKPRDRKGVDIWNTYH